MKFIMFYSGKSNPEKAKEKIAKMAELSKKAQSEGHIPAKTLVPSHMYADGSKAFSIFETDDIENLVAIVAFYEFEHAEIIPIIETNRAIEMLDELKQYM